MITGKCSEPQNEDATNKQHRGCDSTDALGSSCQFGPEVLGGWVCVCVCVCRPEGDIWCLPTWLSTLSLKTKSLTDYLD